MTATHYKSSKGDLEISKMAYPHLANAVAKMEREGIFDDVYAALKDRKAEMDAEALENADKPASAEIGANNPPEETSYEKVKTEIDDLRLEATAWLDGKPVESQAEADKVALLLVKVRDAAKTAEALRVAEKAPFDTGAAEVQTRYNLLIGNNKSIKGTAVKIEEAAEKALAPWLKKLADELEADRLRKQAEADEAQKKAVEAFNATADSSDIEARDEMLSFVDAARDAAINLGQANKAKAVIQTEAGSIRLRTVWEIEVTSEKDMLYWFAANRKEDIVNWMKAEALKTVRASSGNTLIAGVKNVKTQVV